MNELEHTLEIPVPPRVGLLEAQLACPGLLFRMVTEWVGVVLVVCAGLAVIFLLALGAYSLVQVTP